MFGLGFGEILLLMAIGLIVLGPKQMPQVARVIGKTIGELKKALGEATSQLTKEFNEQEKKPAEQKTFQAPAETVAHGPEKPKSGEHNQVPAGSNPSSVENPPVAAEVPADKKEDS